MSKPSLPDSARAAIAPLSTNLASSLPLAISRNGHRCGDRGDGCARPDCQPPVVGRGCPELGVPLCTPSRSHSTDARRSLHFLATNGIDAMDTTNASALHEAPPALPRMYSMTDIATMFDRAPRTIRSWISRGLLRPIKVGHAVFIPSAQIDTLLASAEELHRHRSDLDDASIYQPHRENSRTRPSNSPATNWCG